MIIMKFFNFNVNFLFFSIYQPDLIVIVFLACCYKPSFPLFSSMARTRVTPKKEREGRTMIRSKEERACLSKEAKKELEKAKRRREREQDRWVGEEKTEKKGPPLLCTTPPQSRSPHLQGRRRRSWMRLRGGFRRLNDWRKWVSHHHHCQPNSWPRWLQRLGHLPWGRSLPEGSSTLPSEAKPHRRSS